MPSLKIFGRRWNVGSDDFVYTGIIIFFIKIIWLISTSVIFHFHKNHLSYCPGGHNLLIYLIGFISILSITILIEISIIYVSSRGGIMQTELRTGLPKLLYIWLVFYTIDIAWTIFGTYWSFNQSSGCDSVVVKTVKVVVIFNWLMLLIIIFGIFIVFDPIGRTKVLDQSLQSNQPEQLLRSMQAKTRNLWETRCRILCCCAGLSADSQTSHSAFSDASNILASFFENMDLVPTDIAAGLILIQAEQSQELFSPAVLAPPQISRPSFSVSEIIEDIYHFAKFAIAAYGWPLYIYSNLVCGACQLCNQCRCCTASLTQDDNLCDCNFAAMKQYLKIPDKDFFSCCLHNEVYKIPFFVCLDHAREAVVVSIRGTLSLRDVLTDLTAESEKMDIEGTEDDIYAHKGILEAAVYIHKKLKNEHLLERAFTDAPEYKLVIVGHSLGAGAAALLSILLQPTWPGLQCYAYSPPGGLLSAKGCEYSCDFIYSIVLGMDLIPRLSLKTMDDLKKKLLRKLRNNFCPKYQILAGGFWHTLCGKQYKLSEERDIESGVPNFGMVQPLLENSPSTSTQIRSYTDTMDETEIVSPPTNTIALYPPGRLIHIEENSDKSSCWKCCNEKTTYKICWSEVSTFNNIIVSSKMVSDHMPDAVMSALKQLVEIQVN